jgi:hypothetical protein
VLLLALQVAKHDHLVMEGWFVVYTQWLLQTMMTRATVGAA